MGQISKESLNEAGDARIGLLYDMIVSIDTKTDKHGENIAAILSMMQKHPTDCEEKFRSLSKRKKYDAAKSSIMAFFGGAVAMILFLIFGKK